MKKQTICTLLLFFILSQESIAQSATEAASHIYTIERCEYYSSVEIAQEYEVVGGMIRGKRRDAAGKFKAGKKLEWLGRKINLQYGEPYYQVKHPETEESIWISATKAIKKDKRIWIETSINGRTMSGYLVFNQHRDGSGASVFEMNFKDDQLGEMNLDMASLVSITSSTNKMILSFKNGLIFKGSPNKGNCYLYSPSAVIQLDKLAADQTIHWKRK